MNSPRFRTMVAVGALLLLGVCLQSCGDASSPEIINVSLAGAETYQYPAVGGDEDGARVSTQARHYTISEIRRDAETNWVATFVYQPITGFAGSDQAEIEIMTGSDGAGAPGNVKRVVFHFDIHK